MKKKAKADIVRLVDELLNYAVSCGASDVHFEPTRKNLVVKFRLDGVLTIIEELPIFVSDKVIGRLKVLGGLLTYRKDIPQEGRIPGQEDSAAGGKVADKRLATCIRRKIRFLTTPLRNRSRQFSPPSRSEIGTPAEPAEMVSAGQMMMSWR